jgi:hypothetical protein
VSELPPALLDWYLKNKDTARVDELVLFDRLQESCCMSCEYYGTKNVQGHLYRMSTQYEKELSNWTVECERCKEETRAYWQERWDEYYSSVM